MYQSKDDSAMCSHNMLSKDDDAVCGYNMYQSKDKGSNMRLLTCINLKMMAPCAITVCINLKQVAPFAVTACINLKMGRRVESQYVST
jgi:hypothetical protein